VPHNDGRIEGQKITTALRFPHARESRPCYKPTKITNEIDSCLKVMDGIKHK